MQAVLQQILHLARCHKRGDLPFQNTPEAFYRAIINAVSHTRHALRHSCLYEFLVECSACVLEASVAVEERVGIRVGLNSLVKSLEYKGIVVVLT